MAVTLNELLEVASAQAETQILAPLGISPGGVDPLGLRQINFDLMDRVLPNLNNVARHIRPYTVMAWAWRRVRRILEANGLAGAPDAELRDFVDRIEAIYAWSQFLLDPGTDLPGALAMRELFEVPTYVFGGQEWTRRRDMRRYSTGLISSLNYGPSLQSMGWLLRAGDGEGVFLVPPELDHVLDAFEARFKHELGHEAFNQFGSVSVDRKDAVRWGRLWSIGDVLDGERDAFFERLGGAMAATVRQEGIALIRAAFADVGAVEPDTNTIRAPMADAPIAGAHSTSLRSISSDWRAVQARQVFRLTLEGLLHWLVGMLDERAMHSDELADCFIKELGVARLPVQAGSWLLASEEAENPVHVMTTLADALKSQEGVAPAIVEGLRLSLREAPPNALDFELFDRLPLARARQEAERWSDASPRDFLVRVLKTWVIAQHTYWSVNRGLSDARGRGKTILRLRVVMDEGGWTQTPGTSRGNPPAATPDRLETAISLLKECRRL